MERTWTSLQTACTLRPAGICSLCKVQTGTSQVSTQVPTHFPPTQTTFLARLPAELLSGCRVLKCLPQRTTLSEAPLGPPILTFVFSHPSRDILKHLTPPIRDTAVCVPFARKCSLLLSPLPPYPGGCPLLSPTHPLLTFLKIFF